MTKEIIMAIAEGSVKVTYRVRPLHDDRRAVIEKAAQTFVQTLVDSSVFNNEEWLKIKPVLRSTNMPLLKEAENLIKKSREALVAIAETPQPEPKQTTKRKKIVMTTETTAAQAGEMYATGKSVAEVAIAMSVTYGKARRLIQESGVPVRDASARLKGRTRKINS